MSGKVGVLSERGVNKSCPRAWMIGKSDDSDREGC